MDNMYQELIDERRLKIREASTKLPDPSIYPDGATYKVPCPIEELWFSKPRLVTDEDMIAVDCYLFTKGSGRWFMSTEEYNRHIFKGLYL